MNRSTARSHIVLFFTQDLSLATWDTVGMFEREVALYKRLQEKNIRVSFVTYGDAGELSYTHRLPGISIYCNKWSLPEWFYKRLITHVFPFFWRGPGVVKSNQLLGADIALQASRRCGKKFIARCGYLPSNILAWRHGEQSIECQKTQALEAAIFREADCIVVTASSMQETIQERYGIPDSKVRVIPNYVDVQYFQPTNNSRDPHLLCYVGRLEKEKNVRGLLDAISGLKVELVVIGGGSLKEELMATVKEKQLSVKFLGNIAHGKLPRYFNRSALFILPSFVEHHPKTLLEAMASGLPVIGTNVPGIKDLINHGETGILCGTSPGEIRAAIKEVLTNGDLQTSMGKNARRFIEEHFSLERIVAMELRLLDELMQE